MNTDYSQLRIADFPYSESYETRWSDNDMYGHLNSPVYYGLFDSTINRPILARFGGTPADTGAKRVVAHSECTYLAEVRFPSPVTVGTRVMRIGRSSVTYQCALFAPASGPASTGGSKRQVVSTHPDAVAATASPAAAGEASGPAAVGTWTHVYVDAQTGSSTPIPQPIRDFLESLLVA